MKFDNETSIIQQKIANGYAGISRRLAIMKALDLKIGENVFPEENQNMKKNLN